MDAEPLPRADAPEVVRAAATRYLRGAFPDVTVDDGDCCIRLGCVITWVRVVRWADGTTLVHVWSITNVDMAVTGELTRFLLTTNATLPFGGFRVQTDVPAVHVVHNILGATLARDQLVFAVAAIASIASRFAPRIKRRFGGRLYIDS